MSGRDQGGAWADHLTGVRQHDDGTWYAHISNGVYRDTGRQRRKYKRFPGARSAAEAMAMAEEWARGLDAEPEMSPRLDDVLGRYVESVRANGGAANTVKSYRLFARRYVGPFIGNLDADEVRPYHVEALYGSLLKHGRKDGGPLASSTVNRVHWFLSGAYKWIVRNEIAPFDPMPSVRHPRQAGKPAQSLDEKCFSAALSGLLSRLHDEGADPFSRRAAFASYLSLMTGMRCGECCAVAPADCHFDRGFISVLATVVEPDGSPPEVQPRPKGRRPRNVSVTPDVAQEALGFMEWRAANVRPSGVSPGALLAAPLCCDGLGKPIRPSDVSEWLSANRGSLGLPEWCTFHTLRHTHATFLLYSGVDIRTVQERLGHARAATTQDAYAHVLPGRDAAAASAFGETASRLRANGA